MAMEIDGITTKDELIAELQSYLEAALEWIDAVPKDATSAIAMPGFGRDEAEALLLMRPEDLPDVPPSPAVPG